MNIPSSFDRETLQQFLADAFAVQESRINTHSLSDILQIQRAVAGGKLSPDGAMRRIVEAARSVADAAGVAIAVIDGDHLTYRAGSGTSAVCVGWRVAASLTVAADSRTNREILRVENAQTDRRIQADICRQFGAGSLLILPIYLDGAVAGVLDVRFSEPHVFQDSEIRTYRLMTEQIEAALFQAAPPGHREGLAPELPPIPEALEQVAPADEILILPEANLMPLPDENFVPPPDFRMLPQNENSLYARCGAVLADILGLPIFKQGAWVASMVARPANHIRWPRRRRNLGFSSAGEVSLGFKRSVSIASAFAKRVKKLTWPDRWRTSAQAAAKELSSVLNRSALRAAAVAQRSKAPTWPTRWRSSFLDVARELSSACKRATWQAAILARRAKSVNWPRFTWPRLTLPSLTRPSLTLPSLTWARQWRNSALAAARELSSTFRRSAQRATAFATRAKALRLNQRGRLILETVVIVFAFVTLIAYRGRRPAESVEYSTLSHSSSSNSSPIDPQARPPKPLPGKGEFAAKPSPAPFVSDSRHTSNALRRVQVGKNEVDYVADDVTMRVFTPKPTAKRSRTPHSRIAQFGDDVTVRYFTPPPLPTRTATR